MDRKDFTQLVDTIFNFIKKGRIHSFVDHMSDYTHVKQLIIDAELVSYRYNKRFDSYSFSLENGLNRLVDTVLIFTFGIESQNKIMITLHNKNIYMELAFTGLNKHIPGVYFQEKLPIKKFFFSKPVLLDKKETMSYCEFENFLECNKIQIK